MKVRDKIRDNDPRSYAGGRVLVIMEITDTHVVAQQGRLRPVKIRKNRIYNDGRPRRSGFSLISEEE